MAPARSLAWARPPTFNLLRRESHVRESAQTIHDAIFHRARDQTAAASIQAARPRHGGIPRRQAGFADPVCRRDPDEAATRPLLSYRPARRRFYPALGFPERSRRQPTHRFL